MKRTFIETHEFTEWVKEHLSDDSFAGLQRELLKDPNAGTVMPGCGGLRKLRVGDPTRGKGKRGGVRVIYLNLEEHDQIWPITLYGKDQKDDLSPADKKLYRRLVGILKDLAGRTAKG